MKSSISLNQIIAQTGMLSVPAESVDIALDNSSPFQACWQAFSWQLMPIITGFGIHAWIPPVYSAQDIFENIIDTNIDRKSFSIQHLGLVTGSDDYQVSEVIRGMKLNRSISNVWLHTPHGLSLAGVEAIHRLKSELGSNVTIQVGPVNCIEHAQHAHQAGAWSVVLDCSDSVHATGSYTLIEQVRQELPGVQIIAAGLADQDQEHLALAAGANQVMLKEFCWALTESEMEIQEVVTQIDELQVRKRNIGGQQETTSWPKQRIELYKEIDLNDPFFSCTYTTDRQADPDTDLEPDIRRVVYAGDAIPAIGDRMVACQRYFADLGSVSITDLHNDIVVSLKM